MYTKDAVLINKKIFEVDYLSTSDFYIYLVLCGDKLEDDKFKVVNGLVVDSKFLCKDNIISNLLHLQSLGLVEYVNKCWKPIINYGDCLVFHKKDRDTLMKSPLHLLMNSLTRWNSSVDSDFNVTYNQDPTLNKKIVEKFFGKDRDTVRENFNKAKEMCGLKDISYSYRSNKTMVIKLRSNTVRKVDVDREFECNFIGEMFELACGAKLEREGYYDIEYRGIELGREDGGIDLIANGTKIDGKVKFIQCKYWSKDKELDDDVILNTYKSVAEYLKNYNPNIKVSEEEIKEYMKRRVTVQVLTHTTFSKKAKAVAKKLGVEVVENIDIRKYF